MNRNLRLSFLIMLFVAALPFFLLEISPATDEWGEYWQIRAYLVSYTGYITMMLMSLTAILSVRHWPLEQYLKGLDQQYRLHKYLGISAIIFACLHWFVFLSDDIFMGLNLVAFREERYPFWKLMTLLGEPGQLIGEWGFYIAAVLVLVAWLKYFSYRIFEKTHQIFPYLYFLLVLHVVVFFEASYWLTLPGFVLAITTMLATIGCLITIFNRNGKSKHSTAIIEKIEPLNNGITISLEPANDEAAEKMKSYRAGQFIFANFDQSERGHPFSLASVDKANGKIELLIKQSGDYTNTLIDRLKPGQHADLEGPYGNFTFDDEHNHQIWVAGGIGIAPFLSGLANSANALASRKIDLIYSFNKADSKIIKRIEDLAKAKNIQVVLHDSSIFGRLSPEVIVKSVDDSKACSVWYCGPKALGEKLGLALQKRGLNASQFHRELFDFR